jgi:hypothetical protein
MYDDVFKGKGELLETLQPGVELRLYDTAVALLDEREGAKSPIAYAYFFKEGMQRGKPACFEKYIWKDDGELKTVRIGGLRLAQHAFFHLVEHYEAVVSDQKHSDQGADWWKNTVGKALKRNLEVFAENETGTFKRVESEAHFQKLIDFLWGAEDKFQMRLLTIAKPGYLKES